MTSRSSATRKARRPSHPDAPVATARVFWSGRSQAVRLPKEYRLASTIVLVHREGDRLVLEPPRVEVDENGWPKGFWDRFATVEPSFDTGRRDEAHERPDPLVVDDP